MANHTVRKSIRTLTDLAYQAPDFYNRMASRIGAERRRRQRASSAARRAGLVGAGLMLGAGLVSLFTPTSGAQARRRLSEQATRMRNFVASKSNGAARRSKHTSRKEHS